MKLDGLVIESVAEEIEPSVEIRRLTPTFPFRMINGMCVDMNNEPNQELQDAYEFIKTSCDVEEEIEKEAASDEEEALSTDPIDDREEWEKEPV